MAKLKPTPPPFEPKGEKKTKVTPKAKVIKAPKEAAPALVKLGRVTAGPFFDDRHPRTYEGWTVVVTAGSLVTYYRFRDKTEAEAFAEAVGR